MLDRSTDGRCRRGAAVQNLVHGACFHSAVESAPSNPGTKHRRKAGSRGGSPLALLAYVRTPRTTANATA